MKTHSLKIQRKTVSRGLILLFRFSGTALKRVVIKAILAAAFAVCICLLAYYSLLPPWLVLPSTGHVLAGLALSLLLVFNTQSAYERYWEGRGKFGMMLASAQQMATFISTMTVLSEDQLHEITNLILAYVYAVKARLRHKVSNVVFAKANEKEPTLEGRFGVKTVIEPINPEEIFVEVSHFIPSHLFSCVVNSPNPAVYLVWVINQWVKHHAPSPFERGLLNGHTNEFIVNQFSLERIQGTPIPFSYAVHQVQMLSFFCVTLPFVLISGFGWLTPVAVGLITFGLLGICEIADEIEEPFGDDPNDLPLDEMCKQLEEDIRALAEAAHHRNSRNTTHKIPQRS